MDPFVSLPVAASVVMVIPLWRIYDRAGLAPPLSLLIFLPYIGLFLVAAILAFTDWPALRGAGSRQHYGDPRQPDLFDGHRP